MKTNLSTCQRTTQFTERSNFTHKLCVGSTLNWWERYLVLVFLDSIGISGWYFDISTDLNYRCICRDERIRLGERLADASGAEKDSVKTLLALILYKVRMHVSSSAIFSVNLALSSHLLHIKLALQAEKEKLNILHTDQRSE